MSSRDAAAIGLRFLAANGGEWEHPVKSLGVVTVAEDGKVTFSGADSTLQITGLDQGCVSLGDWDFVGFANNRTEARSAAGDRLPLVC